jgi:polar amino acid transport system substrate-binding protein
MPAMVGLAGWRRFLCGVIAVAWLFGGPKSLAEPLKLVVDYMLPYEDLGNFKAPGFSVEVVRNVFAGMGQEPSLENFPWSRNWMMVLRGETDGFFTVLRTSERERICSFPDEPLKQEKWLLFVRTIDSEKLKFSSFNDLIGHDVAVHGPVRDLFEQPTASVELWHFLREHHNMVETIGGPTSLRMLAAGRVDYAYMNLSTGMRQIDLMGLSGTIEPLLSGYVVEEGYYVCFSKERVSSALVDAFSNALRQFKQTEAFKAIYQKYFP